MPKMTLSDVLRDECSHPDCMAAAMEDAPFPICDRHYLAVVRHFQQLTRSAGVTVDRQALALGLAREPADPVVDVREYVYFIRYRDRVKIGTTINVPKRLGGLPYDEVLAVVPGGRDVERRWHDKFDAHRDQGEWFTLTEASIDRIKTLGICA